MTCCEALIRPFTNVSTLSIPYGAAETEAYGIDPNVQVYIKDGEEYVLSDDMNQVIFNGSSIEIDFGGVSTGFVKVF